MYLVGYAVKQRMQVIDGWTRSQGCEEAVVGNTGHTVVHSAYHPRPYHVQYTHSPPHSAQSHTHAQHTFQYSSLKMAPHVFGIRRFSTDCDILSWALVGLSDLLALLHYSLLHPERRADGP